MIRRILLSLACLFVMTATARPAPVVVDRVVAVVGDEIILQSELDAVAVPMFREGDPDTPEGRRKFEAHRRKILDSLIDKQLVAQQAKELKISASEEEVRRAMEDVKKNNNLDDASFVAALRGQGLTMESYKKQLKQQLVEFKVIQQAVRARVTISEDEVRAFYAQNVRQAAGDDLQVHLRQIFLAVPKDAPAAEVEARRKTALQIIDLVRGGEDFEKVARTRGEDPLAKSGGDLGWVARGDLPNELRELVSGMDNGDVRGPVRSERGLHILQLVEKKSGTVKPYEEVKEQLRRQLYEQQVEKQLLSWTKELRRKAHVEIKL